MNKLEVGTIVERIEEGTEEYILMEAVCSFDSKIFEDVDLVSEICEELIAVDMLDYGNPQEQFAKQGRDICCTQQ